MTTIQRGSDGVYRWYYEMSLYKNPTVLFLICKIFACIVAGIWLFTGLLSMGDSGFWWDGFLSHTKIFGIILAGTLVLCLLGYFLYALIMGGKYCVAFEMDEKGILHTQTAWQAEKARKAGRAAMMTGALAGSRGGFSAGIMASAGRNSMYSDFSKVKSVKAYPRRELIKVNERLGKNQVYAPRGADYDFVLGYIKAHTNCVK